MTRWQNKKTGGYYAFLAEGTDCTNPRDCFPVVIYSPDDDPHMIFTMERDAFYNNFTEAGPIEPGQEPWNRGRHADRL